MIRLAKGAADISKLKSSVGSSEGQTRNLGELFREAKKGQSIDKAHREVKDKRRKQTKSSNGASGIYKVLRAKGWSNKVKYCYRYQYLDENGNTKHMQRKSLFDLYKSAKNIGHTFIVVDKQKARKFIYDNCNDEEYRILFNELCLTGGD